MMRIRVMKCLNRALFLMAFLLSGNVSAAEVIHGLGGPAYPSDFGVVALPRNDDSSSVEIPLTSVFPNGITYFGRNYKSFWVNTNGNITFGGPLSRFTPEAFPVANRPMIAPYWADVDTRNASLGNDLNQVYYVFQANSLYVTWNDVGYYGWSSIDKRNTFQLILTNRDDRQTGDFDVEFRYEKLEWTAGGASGGVRGLGGIPAQVGFDAGDKVNYYKQQDSFTDKVLQLTTTSNVEEPGIWRWEIRDSAISEPELTKLKDVRVVTTISKNNLLINPASLSPIPYKQTDLGDRIELEWRYGAVVVGRDEEIRFSLKADALLPGESRQVVENTTLSYVDPNGEYVHAELGALLIDVLPSIMSIALQTDKNVYSAGENAQITPVLKNVSRYVARGTVSIDVLDHDDTLVRRFSYAEPIVLAVGEERVLSKQILETLPPLLAGTYQVVATLVDQSDHVVNAKTSFSVEPQLIGHTPPVKAKIVADKAYYDSTDIVRLQDRLYNQTTNALYSNLTVVTSITDAKRRQIWKTQESIAQLTHGDIKDFVYRIPLKAASTGTYVATLSVLDAGSAVVATSETQFDVRSSEETGAGLRGRISASPRQVRPGEQISLSFSVSNSGNASLRNLPVSVRLIKVGSGYKAGILSAKRELQAANVDGLIVSYRHSVDLVEQASIALADKWQTQGAVGDVYAAVLVAELNGEEILLAEDTLVLADAAVVTPYVPASPTPVPTLSNFALMMLAALLGLMAWARRPARG